MTSTQVQATRQRLVGPDLARGVMLLLIAMAYAGVYAMAGFGVGASGEPVLDQAVSFASILFLDNRAFPLFAILFGYGLAWSIARRSARNVEPKELRRGLRRRALLLLAFGAVHALLVFPGEILTSYGLAILITGWLLFRSDRALNIALWITGVFYVVMIPLIMMASAASEFDMTAAGIIPGYSTVEDWVERIFGVPFAPLFIAIAYPLLFLVVLGYRAGRARLFERTDERRSLLLTVAVGGVVISLLGALPAALIAVGAFHPAPAVQGLLQGLQILTGVAGGAGYAACFALSADWFARSAPTVTRAIASVGKRSLTFYIFNSVVVAIILHPDLIGIGTVVGHFGALVIAALTWLTGLALASWLERANRPGPLEALMRQGVYGKALWQ